MPAKRNDEGDRVLLKMSTKEWLSVILAVCTAFVSVTAYAFTHFEQRDDAQARELRLNDGIKELRENQKIFMQSFGVQYHPLKRVEGN